MQKEEGTGEVVGRVKPSKQTIDDTEGNVNRRTAGPINQNYNLSSGLYAMINDDK